ncbi:MAG: nitroreductase family protein [Candidatus Omnitrophica bacterium]|jgi:nitroreductase|nr:nitroreductase family protein [Candidatus Omnitrophota bacterium]
MKNKILKLIKNRRSIRKFTRKAISKNIIENILEAGRWAPSGLNNQPWRFMVLEKEKKDALAKFTNYGHIIKSSNKAILVFIDKNSSYNYEKDLMAIGACIQNMLLYLHSQNLGACWLGEILNQRKAIKKLLKISKLLELEAVITIGYPLTTIKKSQRKQLKSLLIT